MTTSNYRPAETRAGSESPSGVRPDAAGARLDRKVFDHRRTEARRTPSPLGPSWVVGSVVAACLAVVAHGIFPGWSGPFGLFGNGIDTIVYRHGAVVVLNGEPLYEFALFDVGLPFTYPPFAALLFVPLALLAVASATTLVHALNLVLVYVAVAASWRALGYRGGRVHVVSAALAVAFTWLEPVRMTIWLGQINLLLLVLVLIDLARPEGSRLRGVGVGVAAGLKLTPAFFVLHLATLKQGRAALTAVAVFVLTVVAALVVVPADSVRYWLSAMTDSERIGALASPANQSIHGALARIWPGHTPPVVLWFVLAVSVAGAALWVAARAHRAGKTLLALTICGLVTPVVSPFAWGHHWVWCVPLIVLTLDYAHKRRTWWSRLTVVAVCLPMTAWYFTDYRGIKAIGIFMFEGSPLFEFAVQSAYIVLFSSVLVVTAVNQRRRVRA